LPGSNPAPPTFRWPTTANCAAIPAGILPGSETIYRGMPQVRRDARFALEWRRRKFAGAGRTAGPGRAFS
jgi:hypothetical protein